MNLTEWACSPFERARCLRAIPGSNSKNGGCRLDSRFGYKAGVIKPPPRTAYTAPSPDPCKSQVSRSRTVTGLVHASLRDKDQGLCQLASILRFSDDAIISTSLEGMIEAWNAAAERIYGYRAEEIVGKSIDLLVPVDRSYEPQKILEEIRAGREVMHV